MDVVEGGVRVVCVAVSQLTECGSYTAPASTPEPSPASAPAPQASRDMPCCDMPCTCQLWPHAAWWPHVLAMAACQPPPSQPHHKPVILCPGVWLERGCHQQPLVGTPTGSRQHSWHCHRHHCHCHFNWLPPRKHGQWTQTQAWPYLNADVSNDGMGREVSQIITAPRVTRRFPIFFLNMV